MTIKIHDLKPGDFLIAGHKWEELDRLVLACVHNPDDAYAQVEITFLCNGTLFSYYYANDDILEFDIHLKGCL